MIFKDDFPMPDGKGRFVPADFIPATNCRMIPIRLC